MFLGHSSHYTTTIIGDILNIKTHHISLQFHVIYKDWFTTMYLDRNVNTEQWEHLFLLHQEQSELLPDDEAAYVQQANK